MAQGQKVGQLQTAKTKALLATGMTQGQVGKEVGLPRQRVNQLAQQYRKEIDQLALQLISESIPLIKDNHLNTLKIARQILNAKTAKQAQGALNRLAIIGVDAKDILTLADKKEYRALQIMGITPSHTPSMVVNMLFQSDAGVKSQELAEYREFLRWKVGQDVANEAQDAEIVGPEDDNGAK